MRSGNGGDRTADLEMLDAILLADDKFDGEGDQPLRDVERRAFTDMAAWLKFNPRRELSEKQRSWIGKTYERVIGTPYYENLVSTGKAPRGREVETPVVLQNLPKKPPGRK